MLLFLVPLGIKDLRQVLFDIRAGNSNLAKSLSEKSTLAMYQDVYTKLILSDYRDLDGIPIYSRICL